MDALENEFRSQQNIFFGSARKSLFHFSGSNYIFWHAAFAGLTNERIAVRGTRSFQNRPLWPERGTKGHKETRPDDDTMGRKLLRGVPKVWKLPHLKVRLRKSRIISGNRTCWPFQKVRWQPISGPRESFITRSRKYVEVTEYTEKIWILLDFDYFFFQCSFGTVFRDSSTLAFPLLSFRHFRLFDASITSTLSKVPL